jgi:hypothetical protein
MTMRGTDVMDRSCGQVDRQRNGGDADLEEPTMQGAQAGDNPGRDELARQLAAGATQPRDPTAATEESADGGGGTPVILQVSKPTLVQQFRREGALSECGVFLDGEELAGQVIGLGGGMDGARQAVFTSLGAGEDNDLL